MPSWPGVARCGQHDGQAVIYPTPREESTLAAATGQVLGDGAPAGVGLRWHPFWSMERVLITGATGLIGSHAAALFTERGWRVRALVRSETAVDHARRIGAEPWRGDLTDASSLSGAARDCRVVLHAAAHLGSPAPWNHYTSVNVRGTHNLVVEALREGVRRFVHVSTVAVYGHPALHGARPIDEEAPTDTALRERDYYERSKRMAEEALVDLADDRLEWCILRPDVVIGERDRHFTPRIVRIARRRRAILPTSGRNDLPLVYAGNVALAAWLAAVNDDAIGRVYNVTDDGELTLRELFQIAAGDAGRLSFVPLPPRIVDSSVRILEWIAESTPGNWRFPLSHRSAWFLCHSDPFDGERIARELGWSPSVSTREGWKRSVRWTLPSGAEAPA